MSEARGGSREELPQVRGQGRLGEATSHLRPGAVALRSHPALEAGAAPEARGGVWEEQLEERWLCGHRSA